MEPSAEPSERDLELQERDLRIAELQLTVAQQQARIEELEARSSVQELRELREIIDAQEVALGEQRQIIENQSALLEELHGHLRAAPAGRRSPVESIPEGREPHENSCASRRQAAAGYQPSATGGRSAGQPARGVPRRKPTQPGDHDCVKGPRASDRALQQKLSAQCERSPRSELPRPGSASRGGPPSAVTPRARSLGHPDRCGARGPSPHASERPPAQGGPRRSGGVLPPARP